MVSGIGELVASALVEHQHNYNMISVKTPTSYCSCGAATEIDLPKDKTKWNSATVIDAEVKAHAKHQSEMILKKISE